MFAVLIILFVNLTINSAIAANSDIYAGYSVHGVQLRHRSDQRVIYKLQTEVNVDLWEHGAPGSRDAYIMLSPENRVEAFDILDAHGMKHYLHISDVAKSLRENESDLSRWQQRRQNLEPFQIYARYAEIDAYLERIARQYPSIVTLVNIGKSFEGRDIKYLKISTSNFTNPNKPIYFMDATMHAREWVTTPVTLYSIHRLVVNLREEDRDLLENIDWIILPIVNPDGYEFSHTDDRLWRGTRSVNETTNQIHNRTCIGVDPNRNFDVNFNTLGVSDDPCSQIYPGHEPFSEVETRYIRDILLENIDRIQIYMNIHSWGNYILYGLDNATLPSNVVHQHLVGAKMGAHIDTAKLPQADFYLVGNSNLMLYGTSGAAADYAFVSGVPMSYTLELPGYRYAFTVPPEYIEQINTETWRGIAASARLAAVYYARNASMHASAREWVTTPMTLYTIYRLMDDLIEGDRDLLENIDGIIMPVVNLDGYEFSHTEDRLWHGTRSVNETTNQITNTTCVGVDPNRNFDVNFNTLGVSSIRRGVPMSFTLELPGYQYSFLVPPEYIE